MHRRAPRQREKTRALVSSTYSPRVPFPVPPAPLRVVTMRRWPGWHAPIAALILLLLGAVATPGCDDHSGPACEPGQYCYCGNGPECFLECHEDTCNLACSHTSSACGAICDDRCAAVCSDTPRCSALCGNACVLECHHTGTCAAQCGTNCAYSCHDTTTCGVRVGPDSTVTCDSVATCTIECAATCSVSCSNVNSCGVSCAPGYSRRDQGNGTITCG
jgi:hypothetical protein